MSIRPTTVERAYQLAASGECAGVGDVRSRLQAEGFSNIAGHLYGSTITSALRERCKTSFTPPPADT
jgi:hypothetical protein